MSALSTRERRGSDNASRITRQHLDFYPLRVKQLDACTPMNSSTLFSPEERFGANDKRMEEHADLARFRGGAAVPLTLLAQRAGTTTANVGSVHDAQAAIGFPTSFMSS
jgi:hypothetical protein